MQAAAHQRALPLPEGSFTRLTRRLATYPLHLCGCRTYAITRTSWPLGHARRPLTDDHLLQRSLELMEPVLGGEAARAAAARLLDPDLDAPAARLAA